MGGLFSGPQCRTSDANAFQFIHVKKASAGSSAAFFYDTITQNRVVIFSKTTCPYCDIVKCIFSELHVPFKVVELDKRNDGIQLQYILTEMTSLKTVPKVFINGACIGGGSDTVMLHSKGRLLDLVNECTSDSVMEGRCVFL
uniref:Glutaredoxin-2, mitochondrial n=1 Tax=Callorhinchus milii TaxID=7868 RepID=A0A4W3JRU3_CALMI